MSEVRPVNLIPADQRSYEAISRKVAKNYFVYGLAKAGVPDPG